MQRLPVDRQRDLLRQVALGDGVDHARDLGRRADEVVDEAVEGVERLRPRARRARDARALGQPALAPDRRETRTSSFVVRSRVSASSLNARASSPASPPRACSGGRRPRRPAPPAARRAARSGRPCRRRPRRRRRVRRRRSSAAARARCARVRSPRVSRRLPRRSPSLAGWPARSRDCARASCAPVQRCAACPRLTSPREPPLRSYPRADVAPRVGRVDGHALLALRPVECASRARRRAQRLLEIGPELVDVLEPDARRSEARRDALALPAAARLEQRARRRRGSSRSRSRRVRRLDAARRLGAAGDVEREQAAEAGVARRVSDAGVRRRSALRASSARSRSAAGRAARASRRLRSSSQAGSGEATMPVRPRNSPSSARRPRRAADDGAEQEVVVAAEVLRRAVDDEVGAVLERAQGSGRAAVESTTTRRRRARAAASRSGKVRSGFEGASSQTRSARSGGAPVWSNSTCAEPPALERAEEDAGAVVARPARARSSSPGSSSASTSAVVAPAPEGKRSACPPSSSPSARLGLAAGRVAVALVVEAARLAVLVGPDRRAVERHGATLAASTPY